MKDLTFKVYNNRRDSTLTYMIDKTAEGWHIEHIAINGDCTPDGNPYFYTNFNQDNIDYPSGFGRSLAWLWEQIDYEEFNREEAQQKLQELADWVTLCEKGQPQWDGWNA